MSFSLKDKNVLITGGTGTIGMAIAESMLSHGAACVIVTGRRSSKLQEAQTKLLMSIMNNKTTNNNNNNNLVVSEAKVHVIPSDISKEDSVVGLFTQIDEYLNGGIVDGKL